MNYQEKSNEGGFGPDLGEGMEVSYKSLEAVDAEIKGIYKYLNALLGSDGYEVSNEGRITIKTACKR